MLPFVHRQISCHMIKEIYQMLGIPNPQFPTFFEQPCRSDLNLGFNLP